MDLAARYPAGFDGGGGARQRQHRIALGVAVSLALHALLLSAWRSSLTRPADNDAPPKAIAVWLRPPPPLPVERAAPLPAAERRATAAAQERHAPAREHRQATHKHPPQVIALQPSQRTPASTVAPQAAPQAVTEQSAPRFDPDAARRMARQIASDPDPAHPEPEPVLQTETKAARAISSAYRPYCKDGIPGGLLAPIYLALKKKDSGCRW